MDYPFECKDVFLINIEVSREPEIPPDTKLQIEAQIKIALDQFPDQLQVNIRLGSSPDSVLKVQMELVGLFKYTGTDPESDKKIIGEFLNNSGIPILWPTFLPVLRSIAATMGVHGLNIPILTSFKFNFAEYEKSIED